jgi:hypothetical protein
LRPVIAGSTGGGDVTTWGLGFVAGVAGVEAGF